MDAERTRTVVYQALDSDGALLYVGITSTFGRFDQHARDSGWWQHVSTITFEHFDTRSAAEARERELIRTREPRWNRAGRVRAVRHRDPDHLTAAEVAAWLRCSRDWVREHAVELGGERPGRGWMFSRRHVNGLA